MAAAEIVVCACSAISRPGDWSLDDGLLLVQTMTVMLDKMLLLDGINMDTCTFLHPVP